MIFPNCTLMLIRIENNCLTNVFVKQLKFLKLLHSTVSRHTVYYSARSWDWVGVLPLPVWDVHVYGCRGDEGGLWGVPAYPGQRPEPREPPAAAEGAETAEGTQGSAAGSRLELVISHSFYLLLKTCLSPSAVCRDGEREREREREGGGK